MSVQSLDGGTTKAQKFNSEKVREAEQQIATLTKKARQLWSQWSNLARKSALAYWSAGKTLSEVKELVNKTRRLTGSTWEQWCKANDIAKSSADQAIIVATSLTESDIEACDSITAAKIAAGVVKVKSHVPTETNTQAAHEPAPEHEPDTVLKVLVKINHLLAVVITMPNDAADHEGVATEVAKAMDVLGKIGTTTLKVVA